MPASHSVTSVSHPVTSARHPVTSVNQSGGVAVRRGDPPFLGERPGDPPPRGGRRGGGRERPDGPGPVRAQPWATGLPSSPVRVMHQRLPGCPASRAARSRESLASSGPYPAAWPGTSDRPSQVASGMVRFTAPSGPCSHVPEPSSPCRVHRAQHRATIHRGWIHRTTIHRARFHRATIHRGRIHPGTVHQDTIHRGWIHWHRSRSNGRRGASPARSGR